MFGILKNLRTLDFYQKNSVLTLTINKEKVDYKIFAVFVLNAKKEDDGGYVYNIYRNEFSSDADFEGWITEAETRSVITTTTDVAIDDDILTLVTVCEDFENSRLVIMARSRRQDEVFATEDTSAFVSKNPKYPKKWYEVRNIKYPF